MTDQEARELIDWCLDEQRRAEEIARSPFVGERNREFYFGIASCADNMAHQIAEMVESEAAA